MAQHFLVGKVGCFCLIFFINIHQEHRASGLAWSASSVPRLFLSSFISGEPFIHAQKSIYPKRKHCSLQCRAQEQKRCRFGAPLSFQIFLFHVRRISRRNHSLRWEFTRKRHYNVNSSLSISSFQAGFSVIWSRCARERSVPGACAVFGPCHAPAFSKTAAVHASLGIKHEARRERKRERERARERERERKTTIVYGAPRPMVLRGNNWCSKEHTHTLTSLWQS